MIWKADKALPAGPQWKETLQKIDYAFQPIVNIHSGTTFGFEALLRGHESAGFSSIDQLFDAAWDEGALHQVDLMLRHKALTKFARYPGNNRGKFFFNLDNRLFDSLDYSPGNTMEMLAPLGFSQDDICFEISEKHRFQNNSGVAGILDAYHSQGFKIAVDDCGTGFAGLQLLYYTEPDYIKIDRFFIRNMEDDPKKRLVVSTVVNFAHLMGSLVIAEGVETRQEYFQCRKIGCDMIQGYFVQAPTCNLDKLKPCYTHIKALSTSDRRSARFKDSSLIAGEIQTIAPVRSDSDMIGIVDRFRKDGQSTFFPVVNEHQEPVGIIRESSFKDYIFSKFGRQLLENPSFGKDLNRFIARIPIADVHSSVEQLIETHTQFNSSEGLIMVDDMKYVGLLSTNALLKLINEKKLTVARNQNPLSQLPGNTMIHEYLSDSLSDTDHTFYVIYFDFDNFKPYNDQYGFRNGDRLIQMFADMLKQAGMAETRFVGHVGGDDFFMGIKGGKRREIESEICQLALAFKKNAESFYDPKSIENGFIMARDRSGTVRSIPLMTVSAAILELQADVLRPCSIDEAGNIIAVLKKEAKQSQDGVATASITDFIGTGFKPDYQISGACLPGASTAPASSFKSARNMVSDL